MSVASTTVKERTRNGRNQEDRNREARHPDERNPDERNPDERNPEAGNPDVRNPAARNPAARNLTVPFILMMLSLLALLVSLLGLVRTASMTSERFQDLQLAWEAVQEGSAEGSELLATAVQMEHLRVPVPAVLSAAYWSLGLAVLGMLTLGWFLTASRNSRQVPDVDGDTAEKTEQAAVLQLMDEMAPLASGDLRVRATVTRTMTGNLADAFNYAIGELRWLVGALGHSAAQLTAAVEHSRRCAEVVARSCSDQSAEIHRSSNVLVAMSGTIAELTADSADALIAAQAAEAQAERGAQALQESLQCIAALRDDADRTTRLMQRLAANVAAIDERVAVVQDVAGRTDLLALNTTIRASAGTRTQSAGDAAADLGRLSDEVAQLAEVLGQTTRDIGSLTSTITRDATDTLQSMEYTTAELSASVVQSEVASDALQAIRRDAVTLRRRVVRMADKTIEHASVVRQLSGNMDIINRITGRTAAGVAANAESLDELQELAIELRKSFSEFRLPDRPPAESATQVPPIVHDKPSPARRAADRAVVHE